MKKDIQCENMIKKIIILFCIYTVVGILFIYFKIPLTRENLLIYGILMFGLQFFLDQLINILNKNTKTIDSEKVSEGVKAADKQDSLIRKYVRFVVAVFLALIGSRYLSLGLNSKSVILLLLLIYSFYILLGYLKSEREKKKIAAALILSILWSCAVVI